MRKHGIQLAFILAAAVLCSFLPGSGAGINGLGGAVQTQSAHVSAQTQPILICKYYNEKDFMVSVAAATDAKETAAVFADRSSKSAVSYSAAANSKGIIVGGIVPHHLLAGKLIASFFKALAENHPETLVVLAPNHKRIGHNSVNTSLADWSTDFGILSNNTDLSRWLITDRKAAQDNTLMEEEHSVSSLIPYIKYYLPETKVVPVLLHGDYSAAESAELGKRLADELSGTSAAVIASVDFSHYLDAATAYKMDEKTSAAIKAFDMESISRMGNDNLDSPPSILTLLSAMKQMGAVGPQVTGHSNSSDIMGKGADYTTSYFTMLFRRQSR